MKISRFSINMLIIGIVLFTLPMIAAAEGFQMEGPQSKRVQLGIRFFHPEFEGGGLSFMAGLYQLSLSVPVNNNLTLVTRLPLGTVAGDGIESEAGLGNIYAGLQYRWMKSKRTSISTSFGIYLPTAIEDKGSSRYVGMNANFIRFFQFLPSTTTFSMNLSYYTVSFQGLFLGIEVGPDLVMPKEEFFSEDAELLLHYGVTVGYRFPPFEFIGEFVGFGILSEDVDKFSDRFTNEAIFGLKYRVGRIQPGFFYKITLDKDRKDVVRGAFGFSLDFRVR